MLTCYLKVHQEVGNEGKGGVGKEDVRYFLIIKLQLKKQTV